MQVLRPLLPWGMADSRALASLVDEPTRLAGLVTVAPQEGDGPVYLTCEDEWGHIDIVTSAGVSLPAVVGPLVVIEGEVEERYGAPIVQATNVENVLPGADVCPCPPAKNNRLNGALKEGVASPEPWPTATERVPRWTPR